MNSNPNNRNPASDPNQWHNSDSNQWNSTTPQSNGGGQQPPAQQQPYQLQPAQQPYQQPPTQQYYQQPPVQQQPHQQLQHPQWQQEEPRAKRGGLFVAIAALLVLGLAAAGGTFYYLSAKDNNTATNADNSAHFEPVDPTAEGDEVASDENEGDTDDSNQDVEVSANDFKTGTDEFALRFAIDGHSGECMFTTGSDFVYRCKTTDIAGDLEFSGDNGTERLTQIHLYDGEPAGITTNSRVPDSDFAGTDARELKAGQRVTIDQITCELTDEALECATPTGEFRNVFGDGVYLNGARDAVGTQCGEGLRTVDGGMNCDDAKRFKEQYWDGQQFTPGPEGYRLNGTRFKCENATTGTVIMTGYDGFCYSPNYETDKRSFAFKS